MLLKLGEKPFSCLKGSLMRQNGTPWKPVSTPTGFAFQAEIHIPVPRSGVWLVWPLEFSVVAPDSSGEGATGVSPPWGRGKEVHLSAPAAQFPDPESSPAPALPVSSVCPEAGLWQAGGWGGSRGTVGAGSLWPRWSLLLWALRSPPSGSQCPGPDQGRQGP